MEYDSAGEPVWSGKRDSAGVPEKSKTENTWDSKQGKKHSKHHHSKKSQTQLEESESST